MMQKDLAGWGHSRKGWVRCLRLPPLRQAEILKQALRWTKLCVYNQSKMCAQCGPKLKSKSFQKLQLKTLSRLFAMFMLCAAYDM